MVPNAVGILLVAVALVSAENELARGWGDGIDWKDLETGLKLAESENKQLMLVIHKSWCGACKNLKPQFEKSKEIEELSSNFVMVNTLDDEEPKDKKYAPDGGYIPRIFFISPEGKVREDIYNEGGHPDYKYFYSSPDKIVPSMKKALAASKSSLKDDL